LRIIELDAAHWTTALDFYGALRTALGAPEGHGWSIDAFIDSMIWGGINRLEPPYTIRVRGIARSSKDVVDAVMLTKRALAEARAEFRSRKGHDVAVSLEYD
jgi:hypothetical protein